MKKTGFVLAAVALAALLGLAGSVQAAGYRGIFALGQPGEEKIYAVNLNGTGITKLSQSGDWWDSMPSASRDGGRIVFVSNRNGDPDVFIMNADGSEATQVTFTPEKEFLPSFSPDGRKIAFDRELERKRQIFVLDLDTKVETQLTTGDFSSCGPRWSPDGSRLAFYGDRDGKADQIYIMDASGQNIVQLTRVKSSPCKSPDWSPDGTKLVYSTRRSGRESIYIAGADGKQQKALVSNKTMNISPRWSPDGRSVIFLSLHDKSYEMHTIGVDGTEERQLTFDYGLLSSPTWAMTPPTAADAPLEDLNRTDFRSVRWGMTRRNVESTETASVREEYKGITMYSETINGLDCLLAYVFSRDKLVGAMYVVSEQFNDLNRYIEEHNALKEYLSKEYGEPLKSEVIWKNDRYKNTQSRWGYAVRTGDLEFSSTWVGERTRVVLSLRAIENSVALLVMYNSLEYDAQPKN